MKKAYRLEAGDVIGVGSDDKGLVIEGTVDYTLLAVNHAIAMTLVFTAEFDYPFAIDSDRDIQIRND